MKIPQVKKETAKRLATTKCFQPEDWTEAAIVTDFSNHSTKEHRIPEKTIFYLQHDGENLWCVAICSDHDLSNARAFPRGPEDELIYDESVQVVLGTGGRIAPKLNMGGYADAFSVQGKCAHFYEMTGNLAGAFTRRYNETPLPNPQFEFSTFPENNQWTAVFKIPLASAGIQFPAQKNLYFNLFRFYRSKRYGWYLPGFGGYVALPFEKAELLTPENNSQRSIAKLEDITSTPKKSPEALLPPRMEYYPASEELAAEVPPGTAGTPIILKANGQQVSCVRSRFYPVRLVLPVQTKVNQEFQAELQCGGAILLKKKFTAKAPATWRHGVAAEYLDKKVPYPWCSPEFHENTVILAHGKIDFGTAMLPQRIVTARGNEILQEPITLEAEFKGKKIPVNHRANKKVSPVAVDFTSAVKSGIEVKTRIEYDGFMVIRARLTPQIKTEELDHLTLRIMLAPGLAQYVNNGSTQELIKTSGFGYCGDKKGTLWVGDKNGGIIFDHDHPLFRSLHNGHQIELNGDELLVHFVTPEGDKPEPGAIFEFFLQFTPFRNDKIKPLLADLWFESWSDYQGYPDMTKVPELKKRIQKAKNAGKKLYLYFSQVLAENAPEFAEYPSDLMASPRRPWYKRAYNPGKNIPCSVICFRGEAGEFILDGVDQLAEKAGLRHVYLDGPSVPFSCENLNHRCSEKLPAVWDGDYNQGRIAGQRAFLKRLRGIFDSRGIKNPIWHHTGGGFTLPTFSLCDFYWDGEQLSRYRRGYLLEPDRFSILYSGYPFGFQSLFLPIFYVDATLTSRQSLAWTAPHGIISAIGTGTSFPKFLEILHRDPSTIFYPYTGKQPHIKKLSDNSLNTSYYLGKNEALLISGNVVYHGTQKTAVDISGLFPGRKLQVHCLNRDEIPEYEKGILTFQVAERDLRVYHIAPAEIDISGFDLPNPKRQPASIAPASELPTQNSFIPEHWRVESGLFEKIPESGLPYGIRSKDKKASFCYAQSLPDNFQLKMKFRHSGKFRILVDGVNVSFDYHSAKGWYIDGMDSFDSLDRSDVTLAAHGKSYSAVGKTINLEVFLIDGRVAVWYDGVRIIKNALPAKAYLDGHSLKFEVEGQNWIAFDVKKLAKATAEDLPKDIHPVR